MSLNWEKNFDTATEAATPTECRVLGELPAWLSVTLLRNGPGRYKFGVTEMRHWFDGMAFMQKYYFKNSKVYFSAKYLKSETYNSNMAAQRIVVSQFGTRSFPDPCKNIFSRSFTHVFPEKEPMDNGVVNFIEYGDSVYAVTESPHMTKIDQNTLDTICMEDVSKYVSLHTSSAHHHMDNQGNVFNFGMRFGKKTSIVFVKTDAPQANIPEDKTDVFGKSTTILGTIPLADNDPCYVHSFGMTENHLISFESPLKMALWKIMLIRFNNKSGAETLDWKKTDKCSLVHIFNYKTGEAIPTVYKVEPFFTFHHANAYEKDGLLFVDYCAYYNPDVGCLNLEEMRKNNFFPDGFECYLKRVVIPIEIPKSAKSGEDLLKNKKGYHGQCKAILTVNKSKMLSVDLRSETLCTIPIEFPRYNYAWNAQEYKYMYGAMIFKSEEEPLAGLRTRNSSIAMDSTGTAQDATIVDPTRSSAAHDTVEQVEDDNVSDIAFNANHRASLIVKVDVENKSHARTFEEVARCYIPQRVPFAFHGITTSNK
ncbi:retinal pigment epithelial membrane protein domain-containing protein [Ditylenchus destructor]|uniref:Retinal pigment epithelial membrane protein domain-containing protein n=1 Tax=Ditylenchus destructor TaxID=166010 RepID=A0AAD4R4U9_9BILA|nr:retinal pigment epithelial membrane protein domain-containing protein [Ditylenchus destructor]